MRVLSDGTIATHAYLVWDEKYKTLTLRRRLDDQPVGGSGFYKEFSLDLDHPFGRMLELLLETWFINEGT